MIPFDNTTCIYHACIGEKANIVYYAPREERSWTVHISCKWAEGEGGKHEMWAGQFFSRGVYTYFPHTEAENDTFPFLRRAGMEYFRPGVRKNKYKVVSTRLNKNITVNSINN